jgi:hypothetical protein
MKFGPDYLPNNAGPKLGEGEVQFDSCFDAASGQTGFCMPALGCPSFMQALATRRNQKLPVICRFEGNDPWICCCGAEVRTGATYSDPIKSIRLIASYMGWASSKKSSLFFCCLSRSVAGGSDPLALETSTKDTLLPTHATPKDNGK